MTRINHWLGLGLGLRARVRIRVRVRVRVRVRAVLTLTLTQTSRDQTSRGLHLGRCESSGKPHPASLKVTYVGRPHAIVAPVDPLMLTTSHKFVAYIMLIYH